MNPQSSSQRPISNKIKCTQQKLFNERQALPKLRIQRVSIRHQLQLMIFSGGQGGGGGRQMISNNLGGGLKPVWKNQAEGKKTASHTDSKFSSTQAPLPPSQAAYFGNMADNPLPSFLFSATSPIPF